MVNSAEKLVKQTVKLLAKSLDLDYDELKMDAKKVIKMARLFDESLLGMMEELLDLGNVGSPDELDDFSIDTIKIYCKIKELDDSGSERSLRARVWQNIEEEFELESDTDEEEEESDDDEEEELPAILEVPEIVPETVKKPKKSKKEKDPE